MQEINFSYYQKTQGSVEWTTK